jgi:anhydro-N-acetylmuramic acid kinase
MTDAAATPTTGVYVGLMSGTSLDGISAAVVRFTDDGTRIAHDLLGFTTRPYSTEQRARLLRAMEGGTADDYCRLHVALGEWLAEAANAAIADAGVARSAIRAIASHGQTVWHVPGVATWQMGDAAVIAERTGVDVVSDFRARDVAAGGHGAPLVPVADALLYADATQWRLLQNIGGMANVTVVPPHTMLHRDEWAGVRAFDTGPGVAVVDAVVRTLYPSLPYDVDGAIARVGSPIESVVEALLDDPYFSAPPPKSTGREYFGADYAQRLIAMCDAARLAGERRGPHDPSADCIATAVALTARSIALAYQRFVPEPAHEVIVSGGGANNHALMDTLDNALARAVVDPSGHHHASRTLRRFDALYYDGEAKEAVAFALLAHLHLLRRPGNIIGATGARGPRVLGMLTPA